MTNDKLRTKIADRAYEMGVAFSFEIASGIYGEMSMDIRSEIEDMTEEGYFVRCYDGRLCLVRRPDGKDILPASDWETEVLRSAEVGSFHRGSKESAYEFRWGRECVGECLDAGWIRLEAGKRHGEGRYFITNKGRAAITRNLRRRMKSEPLPEAEIVPDQRKRPAQRPVRTRKRGWGASA